MVGRSPYGREDPLCDLAHLRAKQMTPIGKAVNRPRLVLKL